MEIENISSAYQFLDKAGVYIEDSSKFIDFVKENDNNIEKAITRIKESKLKKEQKVDYSHFERKIVDYFKKIQNEINKDALFQYSKEKDIENFRTFFQEIVDKYIIICKLKDDKEEYKKRLHAVQELKDQLSALNNSNKELSTSEIEQINTLNFKLNVKNKECEYVLELIEEEVNAITKNSNKSDFIKLIDEFNNDIDKLLKIMDRLSMHPRTESIVKKIFNDMLDELSLEKVRHEQSLKEFDELCVNAGIKPSEPSLEKDDIVIYNGTKPYYGVDNSYVLKEGEKYKVKDSKFTNNGLEEFYLEGFDKPFSVTLFDTPNEWEEKKNSITEEYKDDEIMNGFENVQDILDYTPADDAQSIEEEKTSKDDNEEYLVFTGKVDPHINTAALKQGFSYKVVRTITSPSNEEEIYLEGFDKPYPKKLFASESYWNEHMKYVMDNIVHKVDIPTYNPYIKTNAYTNAVIGMKSKKLSFSLKKALSSTLKALKEKMSKSKYKFDKPAIIDADFEVIDDDIPTTIENADDFWNMYDHVIKVNKEMKTK